MTNSLSLYIYILTNFCFDFYCFSAQHCKRAKQKKMLKRNKIKIERKEKKEKEMVESEERFF